MQGHLWNPQPPRLGGLCSTIARHVGPVLYHSNTGQSPALAPPLHWHHHRTMALLLLLPLVVCLNRELSSLQALAGRLYAAGCHSQPGLDCVVYDLADAAQPAAVAAWVGGVACRETWPEETEAEGRGSGRGRHRYRGRGRGRGRSRYGGQT
jgi:hypothetical protein